MKKIILLLFIFFSSNVSAKNEIVYADYKILLTNSLVAKSLSGQLKTIDKKNIDEFKKIENNLKIKREKILLQKNIISEKEYQKKIDIFKKEYEDFKSTVSKRNSDIMNKKIKAENKILSVVNLIISEYAKENSVLLILDRKSILMGKTELDITEKIIEKLNKKMKKIKLN